MTSVARIAVLDLPAAHFPSSPKLPTCCHRFLPQSPCTASFVLWGFRSRKEGTLEGAAGLSPFSLPNSDNFIFGRIFMISALLLSFFLNITLVAFPQSLPDTWKQYFVFTITCFVIGERWEEVGSFSVLVLGWGHVPGAQLLRICPSSAKVTESPVRS